MHYTMENEPCHIIKLPNEILDLIATCSNSLRATAALACSCKHMHKVFSRTLYKLDATSIFPRALIWSAVHGLTKMAETALAAGTDVNTLCDAMLHEPFMAESPLSELDFHESTPLLLAAAFGHLEIAEKLLEKGANGRWMDRHLRTALHWAALSGHADIVHLLLEHAPATRHADDYRRLKPAEYALEGGHTQIFRRLAEVGPLSDRLQYLCHAAWVGNDSSFRWLLGSRAKFDRELWKYWIAKSLTAACRGDTDGHVQVVETILTNCRHDCNLPTSLTPWTQASKRKSSAGPRMLRLLVEYADTDLAKHNSKHDRSPYAVREAVAEAEVEEDPNRDILFGLVCRACEAKNAESLKIILEYGADTTIKRLAPYDKSAIRRMCSDAECLDLILSGDGGPTLLAGQTGHDAFSEACQAGNAECARLLLSRGVNSGATHSWHRWFESFVPVWASALEQGCFSPVHQLRSMGIGAKLTNIQWLKLIQSMQRNDTEASTELILEKMIAEIPNLNEAQETGGRPPLHALCQSGLTRCAELLLHAGADINAKDLDECTPLHHAVLQNDFATVNLLLRAGADMNALAGNQLTPLMGACSQMHVAKGMAKYLIEQGADTSFKNEEGLTVLHTICCARDNDPAEVVELMRSLIDRGADVNAVAQRNVRRTLLGWVKEPCTPLQQACYRDNVVAAKCLLEHGAEPNRPRGLGTSTLSIAVKRTSAQLVKLLLAYGQDPNAPDKNGETPLHLAFRSGGSHAILKLFLNHNSRNDLPPSLPKIKLRQEVDFSSFHSPAELNHPLLLELLLKFATPEELGLDFNTALRLAELGANNAIRIFVERGIVHPEGRYLGRMLLETAIEFRKFSVMAYLRSLKEIGGHAQN